MSFVIAALAKLSKHLLQVSSRNIDIRIGNEAQCLACVNLQGNFEVKQTVRKSNFA